MSSKSHRAKSFTFSSTTYAGLTEFDVKRNGQSVDMRSDGETYKTNGALLTIDETISVKLKRPDTLPTIGTKGSLTLTGATLAGGLTLGTALTVTAATAMLKDIDLGVGDAGTVTLEFEVFSSDGSSTGIAISGG